MKNFAILGICAIALSACGDVMTYPSALEKEVAATKAATIPVNEISISESATINGGKFTIVGPIKATVGKLTAFHPDPTVAMAHQKLQVEAAELGADAIISVTVSDVKICGLSWGCRVATGTAVKLHR